MQFRKRRNDDGQKLDNDRSCNVRTNAKHRDRKMRQTAAGEDIQEVKELVLVEEISKVASVYAWNWNVCQNSGQDQQADHDQNFVAEFRSLPNLSDFIHKDII